MTRPQQAALATPQPPPEPQRHLRTAEGWSRSTAMLPNHPLATKCVLKKGFGCGPALGRCLWHCRRFLPDLGLTNNRIICTNNRTKKGEPTNQVRARLFHCSIYPWAARVRVRKSRSVEVLHLALTHHQRSKLQQKRLASVLLCASVLERR